MGTLCQQPSTLSAPSRLFPDFSPPFAVIMLHDPSNPSPSNHLQDSTNLPLELLPPSHYMQARATHADPLSNNTLFPVPLTSPPVTRPTHALRSSVSPQKQRVQDKLAKAKRSKKKKRNSNKSVDVTPVAKPRGRVRGVKNFKNDEIHGLLRVTRKILPGGQDGWARVHRAYTDLAKEEGYPDRTADSLMHKFKSVSRLT